MKLVRFRRGKLLAKSANEYAKTAERARWNYRTAVRFRYTNEMFVSLVYGLLFAILCDENDSFYIINVANLFLDARIKNENRNTTNETIECLRGVGWIRTETKKTTKLQAAFCGNAKKSMQKKIAEFRLRSETKWYDFFWSSQRN